MNKIKNVMTWGGQMRNYRNKYFNFNQKTALGKGQSVFQLNPTMADYLPMVEFYDSEFTNIEGDAFAYMMNPNPIWANIKDCGNFPCTGPSNALLIFQDSKFFGSKPRWAKPDFQIIANNSGFAPYMESCEANNGMNAYVCTEPKLGIL